MSKRNKIIYWIATIWLSLGMVSTGLMQLMHVQGNGDSPPGVAGIVQLGYPEYFLNIIGAWKLLGATAILLPGFPLVKEWAYAGFFFLMTGALVSHISIGDAFVHNFPALLLLALTIVSWYFRPDNRKIIAGVA